MALNRFNYHFFNEVLVRHLNRKKKIISIGEFIMRYEKNQYSEGIQICSLIIAGAFLYWGFDDILTDHWFWTMISLLIGFSILFQQIYALTSRGKLRNIVKSEFSSNPNITVQQICANTGFSRKDVKDITMDLKAGGWLRGNFSTTTGQANIVSPLPQKSTETIEEPSSKKPVFCVSCGTSVENDATFCAYCGSKL